MTILKHTNKKGTGGRMVGVQLPERTHRYLTLFTLAKGISKSLIIRNQLDRWQQDCAVLDTIEDLTQQIADKAWNAWLSIKQKQPYKVFISFRNDLVRDLTSLLDEQSIVEILRKVDEKNENATSHAK